MDVHLFTTDVSALELAAKLPADDYISGVIVPSNRASTEKVKQLVDATDLPAWTHKRGGRLDPDLPPAGAAISWMYSQIIDAADLARYERGILNMHGGAIPQYRGANVLQWAIINGESELGITWHELVEAIDAGPIWAESRIKIGLSMTALDLRAAMIAEGIRLFPQAWLRFRDRSVAPRIPDLSKGKIWPPRRPKDGQIEPGWSERKLRDLVRALCPPWPAPTVRHEGRWRPVNGITELSEKDTVPYVTAEGNKLYLQCLGEQSRE